MEEQPVKRKRGRPKKVKLPEEVKDIIKDVEAKAQEVPIVEEIPEVQEQAPQESSSIWDVKIGDKIEYFDANLSYEATGYRPITATQGLDFRPEWFTEARETFRRTGHYCSYRFGSKPYNDFWQEQYRRCREGYTVNGYTITGDNYFFLNFYTLPVVDQGKKSAAGTKDDFPIFFASQYTFFHYYEIAKQLHLHAALMKARSIGFSEINAAIATNMYSTVPKSITMITCYDAEKLKRTYRKFTHALQFLDDKTDGGMFKLRQLEDQALSKKSGHYKYIQGQKVPAGFQSQVVGINGSDPSNIRGDRVELLIYDEAGSWPDLTTAVIQGQELVEVQGIPRGIMLFGGTGGDRGRALEGLRKIYYNPKSFKVLPYKHNYTQTGETAITGFFIPYFAQSLNSEFMDERGVCKEEEFRKKLQEERDNLASIPEEYIKKCAERCWNAEEAFNLEGQNKFNKINIVEQLTRIRALKQTPPIEVGRIGYTYKDGVHTKENITGISWAPDNKGKVRILEHPIWELNNRKDDRGNPVKYEKVKGLYVIGIDGIDIGAAQTSENTKNPSDFCLVVKKRAFGLQEPQYVAIYKDRPNDIREAYKIAIALAQYYNAQINIEATRQSIIPWAREKGFIKLFMKRPTQTLTEKSRTIKRQYGTPATKDIIAHQTDLIADYINDYCHNIWFEDMLEEFNQYTDENKGAFDIVAATAMAELADEELQGIVPKKVEQEVVDDEQVGYYIDERGIKRWGVIPKTINNKIPFNNDFGQYYDRTGIRTSDPRISAGYL